MGRVKLKIKGLENTNGRQATYAKRKNGIMKKANVSILCDIDIVLLMFLPTGKPSLCSGKRRYVSTTGVLPEGFLEIIIPGLQRLGKKDDSRDESFDEYAITRPYLSEAWEVREKRKIENLLMNWRFPALEYEIDMKDNLKWWAHTVDSAVR
ncbi:hypothetical protein ACFX10_036170 [Malus domestica]